MPKLYSDLGVLARDIQELGLPRQRMVDRLPFVLKRGEALRLHFLADMVTVRLAIQRAMQTPLLLGLSGDEREKLQVVLAEVLNNIVEHAYHRQPGTVSLALWNQNGRVHVVFEDQGIEMPEGCLPQGAMPPATSLPEGGFGWYLIRAFSQRVTYRRIAGRNRLHLILKRQQ